MTEPRGDAGEAHAERRATDRSGEAGGAAWRDPFGLGGSTDERIHLASVVRVMRRNFLSWRRFSRASLVSSLGDPLLFLFGIGWGLGRYVGDIDGVPYAQFVASGILASSVMNVAIPNFMVTSYLRTAPSARPAGW